MVVDNHPVVLKGLCDLLSQQKDMRVIAAVEDGETAMQLLQEGLDINMLLTDLNMAEMDGLELTRRSIAFQADLRVLVLTFYPIMAIEHRALAAGAKRCLSKDSDVIELLEAIRFIHAAPAGYFTLMGSLINVAVPCPGSEVISNVPFSNWIL